MLMCLGKDCTCPQHRFLSCLRKEQNEEATSLLRQLENPGELSDNAGSTLLHYSVRCGNAEMTQRLIEAGCDANARDHRGIRPLMLAVKAGDAKTIEVLVGSHADIYAADCDGASSLQLAFHLCLPGPGRAPQQGRSARLAAKLLFDRLDADFARGALTARRAFEASDLLKFAMAAAGGAPIARFLLENRYPVDLREPERERTALHCAVLLARFDNADALMDYGADIDALDRDGCSPLRGYTYRAGGAPAFEDVDEGSRVLGCFLKYSRRLAARHARGGFTELERLLVYGKRATVRAVFESGVDVGSCLRRGKSLLSMLIHNGDARVLELLDELALPFDPNERIDALTPLIEAVIAKCPEKVEFFLRHGADANLPDRTALRAGPLSHAMILSAADRSEESRVASIVELLLRHGAAGVQTFFGESRGDAELREPDKVVVAHLALLGAVEPAALAESTRRLVESRPRTSGYFELCAAQLDAMKGLRVCGTVTLFQLLCEPDEAVVARARDRQFVSAWSSAMRDLSHFETYYSNALRRKLSGVLNEATLLRKAALAVTAMMGLCIDLHRDIAYKVISYLNRKDILHLCDVITFSK
ncbi:ankyrin-3-like [Phymastichus coffea]|uniref:ankyrin-3-like n=1 Tax=Phymastichus coffea TaxID=108790 RepID=UPI00273B954A|nr:ankyrin-3-like [Phymastichus coffea]